MQSCAWRLRSKMRLILVALLVTVAVADPFVPEIKALWQFRAMIKCTIPSSDPLLDYNNYGCYCGMGGSGTPLDALDKCCETHDHCYDQAMAHPKCHGIFDNPYTGSYSHTCAGGDITCSSSSLLVSRNVTGIQLNASDFQETSRGKSKLYAGENGKNNECEAFICECDRAAAICFSKAGYNPEYKNVDKKKYCKSGLERSGSLMGRFLPNPNFRNANPPQ